MATTPTHPTAAPGRTTPPRAPVGGRRPGFTLTEVLISIALVLVLILGVNQVFSLTGQAVGAGQALSTITRTTRNVQTVITQDVSNAEIDRAPFFFIMSQSLAGFRNKADQVADNDFDPSNTNLGTADAQIRSFDRDGDGVDDVTPRAFMTRRTHRADLLKFFVRSGQRRQTGNGAAFSSNLSSSEQFVTYGHLRQPTNTAVSLTSYQNGEDPGLGSATPVNRPDDNPNNYYATSWILGRGAYLMRQPDATTGQITDAGGTSVDFYKYDAPPPPPAAPTSIEPFVNITRSTAGAAEKIDYFYYDLIGASMEDFRRTVMAPYTLLGSAPDVNAANPATATWATRNATAAKGRLDYRLTGFPNPVRPLTRLGVARTVPCFVPHCTQFAVEFAGDFVAQNNTGGVTGIGSDNTLDFVQIGTTRTIRWYGYPRDVNGDGFIRKDDGDVVPVRDVAGAPLPFEREIANTAVFPAAPTSPATEYHNDGVLGPGHAYYAVWGPDTAALTPPAPRPKMLRITMAMDDPTGRIAEEQFVQFVIELP